MKESELTPYMNRAVAQLVADLLKNSLRNPREAAFLLRFERASKRAEQKRLSWERRGQHVPAFLISSITDACNLRCKGCYARANGLCQDEGKELLTADEWDGLFTQASDLGVCFHLLAGGEPLLRRDVLDKAAAHPETLFPVFTNGTLLEGDLLTLFERSRNLVPVLSIEGEQEQTDARRGADVHRQVWEKMELLGRRGIVFGCSLTVTRNNLETVTSEAFIARLASLGCRAVLFVEYVPVDPSTRSIAFGEAERERLAARQAALRKAFPSCLLLSFPGDEEKMGGCLAAGRGFFHISPQGEAQACPFSPYSDRSLRNTTLLEALRSPFFTALRRQHQTGGEHLGGCALFERRNEVEELLHHPS